MKVKRMSSLFCAAAFVGTASMAMAGAYGEREQAEEMPKPAPAVAEAAHVEEFSPFWYIGAGGLYGQQFFEKGAHMINKTYGWGANFRVGYRFHQNVSAELLAEGAWFDGDSGTSGPSTKVNIDRTVWSVMPVVKVFPIQGMAEPFLSVGGGLVGADDGYNNRIITAGGHGHQGTLANRVDDGLGFGMRFGIGADFYATDQIYIEPEVAYVLPLTSNVATYDNLTVSLGIGYAFR